MSRLCIDDPCVFFAMGRESRGFRALFPPTQRFPGAPVWARFCGPSWLPVLVVETGIGPEAAEKAVNWVLSKPKMGELPYEPKLLLFAGFAGSLVESLHVGDLVLATEVIDTAGKRWQTTWPEKLPDGPWQPPLRMGPIVSSHRLVGSPNDKRALGQTHQTLAVDMESATFAALCSTRSIPFGCLRAISDDADTSLSPQLVALLSGGRVSWWKSLAALARRPALLSEFMRLARDTREASEHLGKGLGELLTLTLAWFDENEMR